MYTRFLDLEHSNLRSVEAEEGRGAGIVVVVGGAVIVIVIVVNVVLLALSGESSHILQSIPLPLPRLFTIFEKAQKIQYSINVRTQKIGYSAVLKNQFYRTFRK